MAFAYYNKKDYGSAVECYKKALELNSDTATAYGNIGLIYYEMKDYGKAVEYMEKGLALEPDSSWSYYITGKTYRNKGDAANASYYEEIVKGMAYYRRGNHGKAIEHYEKAIGLKPDYAWAYYNMAAAYEEKSYGKVIEYYEKAAELKPDFAKAYFGIGHSYYILLEFHETAGEYEEAAGTDKAVDEDKAIAALKKAAELNPKFMYAYPSPGDVYYRKGDYGHAIEYWEKQIEARPDYAWAYYNMAEAYYAKGEHGKAIESFEKTLELNDYSRWNRGKESLELPPPSSAVIYEQIGMIYFYGIKDSDKALEYYGKAIELLPGSYEEAYYNMGEIYRERGDKDWELHYKNKAAELRPIPLPPPPLPTVEETEEGKQE